MSFDNNIFKNLFSYTKSERRGILVLILLLMVMLVFRYMHTHKNHHPEVVVEAWSEVPQSIKKEDVNIDRKDRAQSGEKLDFNESIDPNKATYSELTEFGFSGFSAKNLIKYRESGAVYSHWTDLQKIYGVDSLFLSKAKSYLVFKTIKPSIAREETPVVKSFTVELNSADTALLKTLPGIGVVLSQRIVKYRELLGGFYNMEQLGEVYGMSDSLVNFLASKVNIDTSSLQKIHLNTATLEEFQNHPYLTRYQAKAILSYRKLVGNFTSYKSLTENYLIPEEVFAKIEPYLSID